MGFLVNWLVCVRVKEVVWRFFFGWLVGNFFLAGTRYKGLAVNVQPCWVLVESERQVEDGFIVFTATLLKQGEIV